MASTIVEEKAVLRKRLLSQAQRLSPLERQTSDDALFQRFLALPQVAQANRIFAFWGIGSREPETAKLIKMLLSLGKEIALPRMLPQWGMELRLWNTERALVSAPFGLLEPGEDCPVLNREQVDLALVPSLCYDKQGFRLGFGGGYYDRWLADFQGDTVGLCRDILLQEKLPVESHDCPVALVVTEEGLYSR